MNDLTLAEILRQSLKLVSPARMATSLGGAGIKARLSATIEDLEEWGTTHTDPTLATTLEALRALLARQAARPLPAELLQSRVIDQLQAGLHRLSQRGPAENTGT